jgi:PAS domain S-box-containing protein
MTPPHPPQKKQATNRTNELFHEQRRSLHAWADQKFTWLLPMQWAVSALVALWVSPYTWDGPNASVHPHLWAALLLGGAVSLPPLFLTAGQPLTRHLIAICQMLMGALLIHLTGGRLETHFHVFGSLAFLAVYRDYRVLITAAVVVAADHILRGTFWPQSVYGTITTTNWRWLEHTGWVLFEVMVLALSCRRSIQEMWLNAERQAQVEATQRGVESMVWSRTAELVDQTSKLTLASEELQASQAHLQSVIEAAADGIIIVNQDLSVQSANPAALELFACQSSEILNQPIRRFVPELERRFNRMSDVLRYPTETRQQPRLFESHGICGDGTVVPLEVSVSEIGGGLNPLRMAILRDVTDRIELESRRQLQFAVTRLLGEAKSLPEAIPGILQLIGESLSVSAAFYWAPTVNDLVLECRHHWVQVGPALQEFALQISGQNLVVDQEMPGQVWASRKSVWIDEPGASVEYTHMADAAAAGLRTAIVFPIVCGGDVVAVIECFYAVPRFRDTNLLNLYLDLGHQVGQFIQRTAAEQAVKLARDSAEEASRVKSDFLANMSHELRTPLNAIIGYSELLQDLSHGESTPAFTDDLMKINRAGKHLLTLINDVLDISKIEAGKMQLFLEDFAIKNLVQEVKSTIRPLADKNGNKVQLELIGELGTMRGDLTRVRQCLFNLLSNACKFTRNGTITLAVQCIRHEVVFTIRDTGIGMTPEQVARLFQAFTQADASTTRKYGGTGLGLVITRKICELLGGQVLVESNAGQGSVFTLKLPLDSSIPDMAVVETPSPAITTLVHPASNRPTILVIDNDSTDREILKRMLENEGYDVVLAPGGKEGIDLARRLRPMAITLDVVMPGMDGWATLSALKADAELADIPVILVTILDDRNLGFALGASDFLSKPIDQRALFQMLNKYNPHQSVSGSVLIVEDDDNTRELLSRLLTREGWTVWQAENGRMGLESVLQNPPTLILLDLMMPEMDGFTFVHELRSTPAGRSIPIIVVTAKEITTHDRARLHGNVAQILPKVFNNETVPSSSQGERGLVLPGLLPSLRSIRESRLPVA